MISRSHDMFGCLDLLAIRETNPDDGRLVWAIQTTTAAGRTARRRRLEAVAWPDSWRVSVVTHEAQVDPAHRARRLHFLRVDTWIGSIRTEPRMRSNSWLVTRIEIDDYAALKRSGPRLGGKR